MITVKDVTYRIGQNKILADLNVTIPKGQITALIGPNGAGKSTLLNLIARQTPMQAGQVLLGGADISQIDPRALALRVAVVAQQVGVASRLKIRDLVGFGRWPHHQGRPQDKDHETVARALTQFALDPLADRFLDEVSGGQRQRAFVAMACCQDTDWLLLDEPLNNLDLKHATRLMERLHDMATSQAKSIAIVMHDLNYTVSWADNIIAMKDGVIAFAGPTRQVATSDNFSNLFETDVAVHTTNNGLFVQHHGRKS